MKSKSVPSESQKNEKRACPEQLAVNSVAVNCSRRALNYALFLLSKRSYTRHRIEEKLTQKGWTEADRKLVFARLDEWKLLDDFQFAKNFIRSSQLIKPKGRRRLYFELIKKGVDKELIEKALDEELSEEKEQEGLEEIFAKFSRRNKNLSREKFYNRALGFLMRRGFSYDESKKAVLNVLSSKSQ